MGLKLSNIIGAPFQDFVTEQLVARITNNSSEHRSPEQVLFIANKTAWVRLASSVIVTKEDYIRELNSAGRYTVEDGYQTQKWTTNTIDLAQDWVLSGGTSKYNNGQTELRSGIGLDNAYGLGGIKAQGYRPMPGLDSVNIETAGRLGSLRYATIRFKVWNMNQLDIIDTLYFRLGYTMLLEWGHTQYFSDINATKLETNTTGIDNFFTDNVTKEQISVAVYKKIRATRGNYDAMLGTVTNFDYTFNQEGGWDCSLKLIGLGSIMDSQKINNSYTMPAGALSLLKKANATINKAEEDAIRAINAGKRAALEKISSTAYRSALGAYNRQNPVTDFDTLYSNGILNGATYTGGYGPGTKFEQDMQPFLALNPIVTSIGAAPRQLISAVDWKKTQGAFAKSYNNAAGVSPSPDSIYIPLRAYEKGFQLPVKANTKVRINATLASSIQYYQTLVNYDSAGRTLLYSRFDGVDVDDSDNIYDAGARFKRYFPDGVNMIAWQLIPARLNASFVGKLEDLIPRADTKGVATFFTQTLTNLPPNSNQDTSGRQTVNFCTHFYLDDIPTADIIGIPETPEGNRVRKTPYVEYSQLAGEIFRLFQGNDANSFEWEVTSVERGSFKIQGGLGQFIRVLDNNPLTTTYTLRTAIQLDNITVYEKADQTGNVYQSCKLKVVIGFKSNIPGFILENLGAVQPPTRGGFGGGGGGADAVVQKAPTEDPYAGLTSALSAMLVLINASTRAAAGLNRKDVLVKSIAPETAEMLVGLKQPLLDVFKRTQSKDKKGNPITLSSVKTKSELEAEVALIQEADRLTDPYALGLKGFNSSLMSGQVGYDKVEYVNFENLFKSVLIPIKQDDNSSNGGTFTPPDFPVYIKLGYLLYFINNLCTLYDAAADATVGSGTPAKTPSPYFYIDYNPLTNYCYTQGPHFSTDASVCLVQVAVTKNDYNKIFVNLTEDQIKNLETKFDFSSDKISPVLAVDGNAPFKTADLFRGNTMEILLNTRYLYDLVQSMVDTDDHNSVYFKPFMERVLADVNKSLGDVNAFRLGYNDFSNTAVIYDDQFVPPGPDEGSDFILDKRNYTSTKGKAIIPVFGQKSMVRDFEFRTNITTKMSSIIAIGAQDANSGATQSTDGSSFRWLNQNTRDRIIPTKTNPPQTSNEASTNNAKLASKFNKHLATIYNLGVFDRAGIDMARNYLIQGATAAKALDEGSSGAPTIPLNTSFTLDGISGIVMGNVFLLPNSITPAPLKAIGDVPRFGFMVVGLDHTIENNQWLTKIRGQIIRMRDGDSFKKR